jgi:hypothetical protein
LDSCDDQKLLLQNIQKHLEEGKFKLPTDSENQIVQEFCSEDVIASLRLLEKGQETAKAGEVPH